MYFTYSKQKYHQENFNWLEEDKSESTKNNDKVEHKCQIGASIYETNLT